MMNKKNNERIALILAAFSIFILISLIQFKTSYSIGFDNVETPWTGDLGAILSLILKKYFLGHGSFVICSILFMYSYVLFFKKDYNYTKYVKLVFYQLALGLWIAIFFSRLGGEYDSTTGMVGYVLDHFIFSMIGNFIYVLLPVSLIII